MREVETILHEHLLVSLGCLSLSYELLADAAFVALLVALICKYGHVLFHLLVTGVKLWLWKWYLFRIGIVIQDCSSRGIEHLLLLLTCMAVHLSCHLLVLHLLLLSVLFILFVEMDLDVIGNRLA